jgi:serine/threonine protein kinase
MEFSMKNRIDSSSYKYEDAGNGLENYQINEEIGQGSFGKVYSAMDIRTGERVAIKKIVCNNTNNLTYRLT